MDFGLHVKGLAQIRWICHVAKIFFKAQYQHQGLDNKPEHGATNDSGVTGMVRGANLPPGKLYAETRSPLKFRFKLLFFTFFSVFSGLGFQCTHPYPDSPLFPTFFFLSIVYWELYSG